jgi:glycosyltransferase involved in cell wall biosynthesis
MTKISLVICTYDRQDVIEQCLEAASNQSLARREYEIVVVDNGSTDNTPSIVRGFGEGAGEDRVRCILEPARGVSHARNAGARAAASPIIAFIDDDAIADRDLLKQLVETFAEHPNAGCVGGRIDLGLPAKLPRWYSAEFAGHFSALDLGCDAARRVSEHWHFPFGANVAYRQDVLRRAGFFSTALGRQGRDCGGGEELDLEIRIAQLGYEIYYNPFARVKHLIPSYRLRWRYISGSSIVSGRNWAYYEVELLKAGASIRWNALLLARAVGRMLTFSWPRFCFSLSSALFYWAKILRKLRYRWRPAENPSRESS